jgi:hypothetical protein
VDPKSRLRARRRTPSPRLPDRPALRFTPTAWGKLQFFCHRGDTEVGGFGISCADGLLLIEDFVTVAQRVSAVSVAFEDAAVADHFETQVDAGRRPEEFSRVWLHTHPGDSAAPSATDEETFRRVFGGCDWSVMFILARYGETYCRLRFNTGPGGALLIPTEVDYSRPFEGSDHEAWEKEYAKNIQLNKSPRKGCSQFEPDDFEIFDDAFDFPDSWEDDYLCFDLDEGEVLE